MKQELELTVFVWVERHGGDAEGIVLFSNLVRLNKLRAIVHNRHNGRRAGLRIGCQLDWGIVTSGNDNAIIDWFRSCSTNGKIGDFDIKTRLASRRGNTRGLDPDVGVYLPNRRRLIRLLVKEEIILCVLRLIEDINNVLGGGHFESQLLSLWGLFNNFYQDKVVDSL